MGMSKMGRILVTASAAALTAGAAFAGGIDRSGQSINPLFEKGNYAELSFGSVTPTVSGKDRIFGSKSGNVAGDFLQYGFAYKADINDQLSYAVIFDQPFGADIKYPVPGSTMLGGTLAKTTETALTGLLRYKFDDNWSTYGGLRLQQASGQVLLSGVAYGPTSGYNVELDSDYGLGYVVGVAFEKPEIALRVALTYQSKVKHDLDTTETFAGVLAGLSGTSVTTVETPQSINLDVQTGVAANTLVFGQIRWVDWSAFDIDPISFTKAVNGGTFVKGGGLVDLDDTTTYTVGVGHKFNDNWSGAASINYEKAGDPLVSPLAPTNGQLGLTLAGIYTSGNTKVTAGINYTKLGDAQPETSNVARADFTDNSALGMGIKVGFNF